MGGVKYESARWRKRTEKFQQDPCIGVYRLCVKVHFFYSCNVHYKCRNACLCEFFFSVSQSAFHSFRLAYSELVSWSICHSESEKNSEAVQQLSKQTNKQQNSET